MPISIFLLNEIIYLDKIKGIQHILKKIIPSHQRIAKYFLIQRIKCFTKDLTATDIGTTEVRRMERSETLKFKTFYLQISNSAFHFISTFNGKIKW